MEELVDSVLEAAHPRLRELCQRDKIIAVFEDLGAFDQSGVRSQLEQQYAAVEQRIVVGGAAPEKKNEKFWARIPFYETFHKMKNEKSK